MIDTKWLVSGAISISIGGVVYFIRLMYEKICKHEYRTLSVTHTQPVTINFSGKMIGEEVVADHRRHVERMAKGFTHVVMRCIHCGALTKFEAAGIHNIQVDKD